MSVAVIVGSAFTHALDRGALRVSPGTIGTRYGPATLHRVAGADAWLLFRHGLPHRYLPHQVPYRAHAAALAAVGCRALLVTSSVGVLDPSVPLYRPLLVGDAVMLDNRLPDGSACTMFPEPSADQGHLVLEEGLFSRALGAQLRALAAGAGAPLAEGEVVFLYRDGPRTKTAAENRLFAGMGAQVNSMSLAPEVVLANELEIPAAAVVVGHKYSVAGGVTPDRAGIADSLERSRAATEALVLAFLRQGRPVDFANHIYRFGGQG